MPDDYAWTPGAVFLEQSNVARFMARHAIGDFRELVRRSAVEPEWFWPAVIDELGLEFFEPYEAVLDESAGTPWARWFVGGAINVAHNCVDRHANGPDRDRPAIDWEGEGGATRTWSYADLADQVDRLAAALRRLGVARGDRVGLFLPMVPEAAAGFFAVAKLGAIVVPIFSGYGAEAVAVRLRDAEAVALLTVDGFTRKGKYIEAGAVAAEAAALSPTVRHLIAARHVDGRPAPAVGDWLWWDDLLAAESPGLPCERTDAEDPFLIAYTSGTTGRPKGAVHVHGGFLVKIAQEVAHQVDMRPDDRLCWVTDLGWIMGPWELVGGLARGGTVVLYDGAPDFPGPDRLGSLVERHRVTILGVSPTLIRALMRHGDAPFAGRDLSSLRVIGSTGETWNPDPWRWCFEKVGGGRCPIINISGGTEVGACLLSAFPVTPLKPCALVGPALGMAVDVVDPEGRSIRGAVGELVCRKPWPSMTRGLWRDPDRYIETYWSRFPGVWTHGDWASVDDDGDWFLHGRSDDTIKVAGKRLGPAEIESALASHPAVVESAAVGIPHELKGESAWCFVVVRPGVVADEALANELRQRVVADLGKAFAPDQIRFVTELPRTRSAKILRRAIRAIVAGEDLGDLSSLENPRALDEIARAR